MQERLSYLSFRGADVTSVCDCVVTNIKILPIQLCWQVERKYTPYFFIALSSNK